MNDSSTWTNHVFKELFMYIYINQERKETFGWKHKINQYL